MKAEVSSIESVEFFEDVKPPVIPLDPRQREDPLQVGLAALAIRPSSSSSSIDEGPSTAPGPSRYAEPWGLRGQRLSHVPKETWGQRTHLDAEDALRAQSPGQEWPLR